MSQDMAHMGNHKQLRMEWEVGSSMKSLEWDWPGTGLDRCTEVGFEPRPIKEY